MSLTFALRVHLSAVRAALFCTNRNLSMSFLTTQLDSSPDVMKLEPVRPVWLTEISRKQSKALSWADLFQF